MSFYSQSDVKANRGRKLKDGRLVRHQCDWCSQYIEIGRPMVRASWVWCGDFCSVKMHPECRLAANALHEMEDEVYYNGDFLRGRYSDRPDDSPRFPPMFEDEYSEMLKHKEITPYAEVEK